MSEQGEMVEQNAVLDASPGYLVEAETASTEDVPLGYKRTEVGVIPADWEVQTLGNLAQIKRGASPRPIADSKWFDAKSTIGWLRISDVAREGKFIRATDQSLSDAGVARSRLVRPGSVVMSMAATVGRPAINRKAVCIHDGFVVFEKPAVSSEFLYYFLLRIEDDWTARGQIGSQVNLNTHIIASTSVPLPGTEAEQRAIATALSDADALIESLDRLIAKKRAIKQAAMQQLLTGQTRLPGFTGEWETKRLGEISTIAMGRTPSRNNAAFWGRGHVWLSIADLQGKVVSESKEQITDLAAAGMTPIPEGTLLMSFKLSIGRLCFAGCDLFTNEAICSFTDLHADEEFIYYALSRTDFSLYGKQAVKGYTLNSESLNLVEVLLPPEDEQTAIATALSDMDTEIETLERRRDKVRQIKQGMMQQLLTGRTRLVDPKQAA